MIQSVDKLIGSVQNLNNKRSIEGKLNNKNKDSSVDSVTISSRVNKRLEDIENTFKEIQSSLTKNQMIYNGVEQLQNGVSENANLDEIYSSVKFNGENVLENFVGKDLNGDLLMEKQKDVGALVNEDIMDIKKLQVELNNITASNLGTDNRADSIINNVDKYFGDLKNSDLLNVSQLSAESVMKLIR